MNAKEKVAYLKGLLDGVTLDETKPETKIIRAMADVLDCFAEEISVLEAKAERAEDYLDELDHDLGELEADFYECEDDDDYEDEDDEFEYCDDIDDLLELDGVCTGECETCPEQAPCTEQEEE